MNNLFIKIKSFFKSWKCYPEVGLFKSFLKTDIGTPQLGGVCAGLAYQLKMPVFIIRFVLWSLYIFSPPSIAFPLLLFYFILCFLLPKAEVPEDYEDTCEVKFKEFTKWDLYRIPGGVWGGVLAGLAHRFKLSPVTLRLIRLLVIVSCFFITGVRVTVFSYVVAWILLPRKEKPADSDEVAS